DLLKSNRQRSRRITKLPLNKRRKVTCDSIVITGLEGTLGTNLIRLGDDSSLETPKARYFVYLSKNGIIDLSDMTRGSQLNLLGNSRRTQSNLQKNYSYQNLIGQDCGPHDLTNFTKWTKKVTHKNNLSRSYQEIGKLKTTTDDIYGVKSIF
ncbi:hypothetical protein DFQ28_000921, partial [Apophysomyces sp. BC1034]